MSTAVAQQSGDENPLVEGLERLPVHPTALVIFGATGDLAHRKLLPALYNLAHEGALPERFELIGVSRRDTAGRGLPRDGAGVDRAVLASQARPDRARRAAARHALRVRDRSTTTRSTTELDRTLSEFDEQAGRQLDRVFYLSTAPEFFPVIAGKLGAAGLNDVRAGRRSGS